MTQAASLKEQLDKRIQEIEAAVAAIDDSRASDAPAEGEWCVKEVLSHLAGSEAESFTDGAKRFLEEDEPQLDVTPGETYFGDQRQDAGVGQLVNGLTTQYRELSRWVGGLTDEQLERKARIPGLKETPLGENPTLGVFLGGIINFHLTAHVQQLQNLCK